MGPKNGGISDWDTGVVGPFPVGGWVHLRSVVTLLRKGWRSKAVLKGSLDFFLVLPPVLTGK